MADISAKSMLLESFCRHNPTKVAEMLEVADADEAARLLETPPPRLGAGVLGRLSSEAAALVTERLDRKKAADILSRLDPGQASILLARLDEPDRQSLLDSLPSRSGKELRVLLSHSNGTAGQLMDPRVRSFRPEVTAGEALGRLRRSMRRRIHDVFLVDDEGRLNGTVSVQSLALAEPNAQLSSLSRPAPASVPVTAGEDEVAELLEEHALVSLPVVDFEGRLAGVLRPRALLDTVEREATSDIQSMVGVSREERALSSVSFAVRKRLPWLQINLATAFLAAAVVGLFEETIARFTALAVLLPVVAGQSGNTGSQALAVTLRGLALREIRLSHWPRVTLKEAGVGSVNGLAVAAVTALGVYLWSGSSGLCLVIALAMVLSMSIAGVTGALIPMVLSSLGQDPAQSSSIFLTTVTDVAGFFSFLGLATMFANLI